MSPLLLFLLLLLMAVKVGATRFGITVVPVVLLGTVVFDDRATLVEVLCAPNEGGDDVPPSSVMVAITLTTTTTGGGAVAEAAAEDTVVVVVVVVVVVEEEVVLFKLFALCGATPTTNP